MVKLNKIQQTFASFFPSLSAVSSTHSKENKLH